MSRKNTKKPRKFSVGKVRVRAIRGPRPDGTWYWRAEIYEGGSSSNKWTGWATRDEVERAVAAIVVAGTVDEPRPRQADRVETVQDLMEVWVGTQEHRSDLSPRSIAVSKLSARHVIAHLGDVLIVRLDLAHLERFRDLRLDLGNATRTVELDIEILRRAWRWGVARGLCPNRKLAKPNLVIKPVRDKHTPCREDYWKVVRQLKGWPALCLKLLGATGARISEVANLKWEDIDLEGGEVIVRGKTGPRTIIIPEAMVAELTTLRPESGRGRVLPVTVGTARAGMTQRYLKTACKDVGVRYFTCHAVRRMVIDQYYENGVDVGTVAQQLGQSPQVALRYYRKATRMRRRQAVLLAGIGEPVESNVVKLRRKADDGE